MDAAEVTALNTRDLMWDDVTRIPWDALPVGPDQAYVIHARCIAGNARSFKEFYAQENRSVQEAIERWLTRYSAKHTHPDLRR